MTKLILSAVVIIAGGIFWAWKRYGSKSAVIARKKKRLREIRKEMRDALRDGDNARFHYLREQRQLLNADINDLR